MNVFHARKDGFYMNDTLISGADELAGCYDICYSPDEGIYYVDLLWMRRDSPAFRSSAIADKWAKKNGGMRCLRRAP